MNSSSTRHSILQVAAWLACAAMSACTTFSADGGFHRVADETHARLGKDLRWPRTDDERRKSRASVDALLGHRLQVDDAVQVALLNNPGLQAAFEELGISEADLVQSGRLPNPGFTFRHASAGGLYNIEETLTFNVLALLTTRYAHAVGQKRFAQVQDAIVVDVAQLADRTRVAYFTAVAAHDSLDYAWKVKNAAQTSAELARRMRSAGNWNRLEQLREQDFYVAAVQDLTRAKLADDTARADLDRLLGLERGTEVQLAEHLPQLPTNIAQLPELERTALESRIDLQLRRTELDELAQRLKLTRATRFVNVLDIGPTRIRDGTRDDPFEKGYEVTLEVPIFDGGDARARRAEALYAQSVDRLAQAALDARADVRKAAARYRTAFELAVSERDDVVPLRSTVTQQDLLRYNASLLSVFSLLADAREQITSVSGYISSVRDFWIAKSRLDTSLIADSSG